MIEKQVKTDKRLAEIRENRRVWYNGMGQVTQDIDYLLFLLRHEERLVAVLHSIAIGGIGGSINQFWERLNNRSTDDKIRFCQALHQLCETMGHNNESRCLLCERLGARDNNGRYAGDKFFDGSKPKRINDESLVV